MSRLRRFYQLAPLDRRLLIQALFLVVAIRLALWLLPFPTIRRLVTRFARPCTPRPFNKGDQDSSKLAWAVKTVSRYVPAAACLTQALAAQVLLGRRGFPSRLHIGVAKGAEQQFMAHAWVECQGKVVIGAIKSRHYTPLFVLDQERTRN
jgi:hypothetical protein